MLVGRFSKHSKSNGIPYEWSAREVTMMMIVFNTWPWKRMGVEGGCRLLGCFFQVILSSYDHVSSWEKSSTWNHVFFQNDTFIFFVLHPKQCIVWVFIEFCKLPIEDSVGEKVWHSISRHQKWLKYVGSMFVSMWANSHSLYM